MTPAPTVTDLSTASGLPVPAIGLGTHPLRGDACASAVQHALGCGYRVVDTAQSYENEADVGRGLERSGVPREDVFVVTKVAPENFAAADFLRTTAQSRERLGGAPIDLLLLHWASDTVTLCETLGAAADVLERGDARAIGVSNFTPPMVEEALRHAPVAANQMELHPLHPQDGCLEQARRRGLLLQAYSPLAGGRLGGERTLEEIGERRGCSAQQVALRWIVQRGAQALPRAARAEHRAANLAALDLELTGAEMERIDALGR